jgi:hypothetical protein
MTAGLGDLRNWMLGGQTSRYSSPSIPPTPGFLTPAAALIGASVSVASRRAARWSEQGERVA